MPPPSIPDTDLLPARSALTPTFGPSLPLPHRQRRRPRWPRHPSDRTEPGFPQTSASAKDSADPPHSSHPIAHAAIWRSAPEAPATGSRTPPAGAKRRMHTRGRFLHRRGRERRVRALGARIVGFLDEVETTPLYGGPRGEPGRRRRRSLDAGVRGLRRARDADCTGFRLGQTPPERARRCHKPRRRRGVARGRPHLATRSPARPALSRAPSRTHRGARNHREGVARECRPASRRPRPVGTGLRTARPARRGRSRSTLSSWFQRRRGLPCRSPKSKSMQPSGPVGT